MSAIGNGNRPELPEGWEWKALGDVVVECRRGRPPAYEGGATLVINQKCVRQGTHVDLSHSKRTNEAAKELPDWALLREGDILINSTGTGTLGRVGWFRAAPGRMTLDTHVTLVRPNYAEVVPAYLGWWLHGIEPVLISLATGSTNQKELGRESIKNLKVPVPPLEEQGRIVGRIEELFSEIDRGDQQLDEASRMTALLKRQVAHRALLVSAPELPAGWGRKKLSEVARLSSGGTPSRGRPEFFGADHIWVKIGDLTEGIVSEAEESLTQEGLENSSAGLIPEGTVLLAMYGASIGRTGVLGKEATTNQAICAMQPDPNLISAAFLLAVLQSNKEVFVDAGYGGAQPNISQRFLKEFEIPVPPLDEQARVVEELRVLHDTTTFGSSAIAAAVEQATRLRRSVLAAAVGGRL
jgi:type I restriction enzyme S subunit